MGIKKIRPKSLLDLVKAAGQYVVDEEDEEDKLGPMVAAGNRPRSLERRWVPLRRPWSWGWVAGWVAMAMGMVPGLSVGFV